MRLVSLLAACALALAGPAAARDLTIAVDPDTDGLMEALQKTLVGPFTEATGRPAHLVPLTDTTPPPWDVAEVREAELQSGCAQGLFEKLDWPALGGRDRMLPQGASDCGLGAFLHSTVLVWDRDKFSAAPTWQDFWDVAKYPGKRGLFHGARGNLEIALLADGVAPGDVYSTLRGADGIDRAFRKLDQLKPYVQWWTPVTPPVQILGSGAVLMTSAPNAGVAAANRTGRRNFAIQWTGSLYAVDSWAIVKASPDLDDAKEFLRFAADPVRQAALLPLVAYGPLARGANDKLPPDLLAISPSAPANLANALHIDAAFWHDSGEKLEARFEEWLRH